MFQRFRCCECYRVQKSSLSQQVLSKIVGPLWTHSCFPFEDYNGDLKDLFHGTQNIPGQVNMVTFIKLKYNC